MNNQVFASIINEVLAAGYTDQSQALHEAVMKAIPHMNLEGHMLSERSRSFANKRFEQLCQMMDAGQITLPVAFENICATYENVILEDRIEASVAANVLTRETADMMKAAIKNKANAPKTEAPKAEAPKEAPKTNSDFLGGVKKGLKGMFANMKKEVASVPPVSVPPVSKAPVKSYGKLDTVHEAVGKGIDVVHDTNNVVINGAATIGCGAVNVAAGLAKSGILATSVVAKEVNKLGRKTGHMVNDGAYEIGKSVVNKTVSKDRNMSIDAIYDL